MADEIERQGGFEPTDVLLGRQAFYRAELLPHGPGDLDRQISGLPPEPCQLYPSNHGAASTRVASPRLPGMTGEWAMLDLNQRRSGCEPGALPG